MKPSMNIGGGAPVLPDWKQQRNAWQDQMQGGNMGDPAFRQQMFANRDAWQQARNGWASQQPVMSRETLPVNPMVGQNPALSAWFQQHLGMRPAGLFPFAPTQFPGRMG